MPRPFNKVPSYKLHTSTGNARCWVGGKWVTLGKHNTPESRAAYARLVADLAAPPTCAPVAPVAAISTATAPTIDEVILLFLKWAEQHYRRPDGTPTNQIVELKSSFRPLHKLYGGTTAREFGPLALKTVRDEMVRLDWCRTQVNARIGKVKRLFKWAVAEELVPAAVLTALEAVEGLRKGRSAARESKPIKPVAASLVEATLPFLNRHVRGLVEFQRLTGCRPGEACRVRLCDIDTSGPVWLFRLDQHKTAHEGKARVIAIGPKAQEVLKAFLTPDPSAYLFDPRTESPRAGVRYTAHSYYVAVRRAANRAGLKHWHVNQLRHQYATEVRRLHGLEAAQVMLGHSRADVTQVYAEKNLALAQQVAREVG